MARLFHVNKEPQYVCWDRKLYTSYEEQSKVMGASKTVYVGNLSFFTSESQIYETFSLVGPVKRVIMGLNSITKQPCGFCFVEYHSRQHTLDCLNYISGTICDNQIIRCDLDAGYKPGRQYGRGQSGGQVRDERKLDYSRQGHGMSGSKRRRWVDVEDDSTKLIVDLNKGLASRRDVPPPPPSVPFPSLLNENSNVADTVVEVEPDDRTRRSDCDEDADENTAKRSRK